MGISHVLRSAASLTTKKRTAVDLTRTIQQMGASLTATGTKEHVIYSIESDRNNADVALDCLLEVVFDPAYHHWEIDRLKPNMQVDLALHKQNHEQRVIELLHQAAFRTTIGRPLYAPEFMLGNYEPEMLKNYAEAHYKPERMAIVGFGCPHEWLHSRITGFLRTPSVTTRLFPTGNKPAEIVPSKRVPMTPNDEGAKYWGGQNREDADSNLAMMAFAGEGVSLASKQMPAAFVLQRIFGTTPRVKWSGSQNHGRLPKAIAATLPVGSNFAVSGINYNYSDCGLFGFFLAVEPSLAAKAARAAVLETAKIANGNLTDSEVKVAKQLAKADLLFSMENDATYAQSLAQSALVTGELVSTPAEAVAQIDTVTMNDVLQVAKRVVGSRTSMAAVGDLSDTPYLEQIIS
jgi:ubiquinol-cytochrome c reductase core subunit 2